MAMFMYCLLPFHMVNAQLSVDKQPNTSEPITSEPITYCVAEMHPSVPGYAVVTYQEGEMTGELA